LQQYPVVAIDALFKTVTAVISAVLSRDEHLSQKKYFLYPAVLLPIGVLSYLVLPCQATVIYEEH
jgi:hypothetical protein